MMDVLAYNGGKPVRDTMIQYGKQHIDQEDIDAVLKALTSPFLTTGPTVKLFEEKLAKTVDSKYAVAVCNGTAALHLACMAAGITDGDEVIVSSMTFAASSNCVLYCGATPVFADIDSKTYTIDPDDVSDKVTSRTKAIIFVDYMGHTPDIDLLKNIAVENQLTLIEDASHSLGAKYKGKKVGSLADMTTFSFFPVKPITTGEGGAVTTSDPDLYNKLKLLRTHGITRTELNNEQEGNWFYEQQALGYNYRITDIQCALGMTQLSKLERFTRKRKLLVELYNKAFEKYEFVDVPYESPEIESSWHIYVIALKLGKLLVGRKEIYEALISENIGVNVHYIPVYYHPYYKNLGYKNGLCPNTESLYERIITLPLYYDMSKKDVEDVVMALKKVIRFYKK